MAVVQGRRRTPPAPALLLVLLAALVLPVPAAQAQCASGQACVPTADAGADRLVTEGSLVRLQGSHEAMGNVTYSWAQVDGPIVALGNATSSTPSFRAPLLYGGPAVELQFRLHVTASNRTSKPDYVTVRVVEKDSPPIADAGGTQTRVSGELVTLNGTGSRAVDDLPLTYEWTQILAQDIVFVALTGNTTSTASFVAPEEFTGEMHFRLRVSDGRQWSQDETVIIVRPPPVPPPVHFTFQVDAVVGGANVTFTAGGGVTDATWSFGDGSPSVRGASVTHRFAPGLYNVTMTVGSGAQQRSETQQVVVPQGDVEGGGGNAWLPWVLGGAALLVVAAVVVVVIVLRRR